MAQFTGGGYVIKHLMYEFCHENAKSASREYESQYPDKKQPNRHMFALEHCSLKETGAFTPAGHWPLQT
jgi:hypothetical protein